MQPVKIHDKTTINTIKWETKKEGNYVRDYFTPMLQKGVTSFISNAETTLYLLEIDDLVLPVTVNDKEFQNSYVCSPYTHYISYAKEELWELKMPRLEKLLAKGIDKIGAVLRKTNINRVVSVNNWILSTNLYFPLTDSQIKRITDYLIKQFPSHTILFRSLNKALHQQMIAGFEQSHYQSIMSRSIYLFDPNTFHSLNRKRRKDFLNDKSLMKKSFYQVKELSPEDEHLVPQLKKLYDQLYIHKYSEYNPQFTSEFYRNAVAKELITFKLLEKRTEYDGVIGYFKRNNVLTTPILGYETLKEQENGLYRLLSLVIMDEVLEKNYLGHFSAGAGSFKRNRGSVQEIEYSFFYNQHLPLKSVLVWRFLKFVMDKLVEPLARKWQF